MVWYDKIVDKIKDLMFPLNEFNKFIDKYSP